MKEWLRFLEEQKKVVGSDAINRWAHPLKIVQFDAGNLYLEATDPFQLNWFEEYLRPLVQQSFLSSNGRPIKVHLTLAGHLKTAPQKVWKPPLDLSPDSLYPQCTFETYFEGETHAFNVALLKESTLEKGYNPVYLQGEGGVGKTHLLMAVAHLLKQQGKNVFYVKADRFTQHIVAAIKSGAMPALRELYRKHDALLIDDIESLADRAASQEELFHTFNSLHLSDKKIFVSGEHLPSHLKGIEPRLTSRFEWGIVLSFKALSPPERAAYFSQLLAKKKITLEETYLLECLKLMPTLPLLNRTADILGVRLQKSPPSLELLHQWFAPLIAEQKKKALTPEIILKTVATHFDIHLDDLQGRSQAQEHTTPRQIAMYLCRQQLHFPYMKIAALFERDHSTVMTSVKLIEKKMQDTPSLQEEMHAILENIKHR